jgi:hypothetical protein
MTIRSGLLALVFLMAALGGAEAADPPRRFSVTLDPLYLTAPIAQVTAEYRPVAHWSAALLAGMGSYANIDQPENKVWQMGAQARWYPFSPSRHEPHFLTQFVRSHQRVGDSDPTVQEFVYDNYDTALLGGYKYTSGAGFTFEVQTGLILSVERERGEPVFTVVRPHLNMGVGWSF